MIKRISALILVIVLLFSNGSTVFACDENQTNTYVTQILFGYNALSKQNDENVKMLMSALYLCCEQSNNQGKDKIDYLKRKGVSRIPEISELNISSDILMQCSHCGWEKEFAPAIKSQTNRKKVLQNTVNKVFDFGLVNNWFGSERGKCNSFAALLYYSHILSDYLADDPSETEVSVNGKMVSAYAGKPYAVLNGNKPSFTTAQMKSAESFVQFSPLDGLGRAGVALVSIGHEKLPSPGSREGNVSFNPSGWNQKNYQEIIGSEKDSGNVYERCHLIAYMLGGEDLRTNVITGTRYLNKTGMLPFEKTIEQYIRNTNHHVLYRVTPIYKGDNKLASGVQLEAYSVEDKGRGICYNVYCYNVQPGIDINYTNGENGKADLVTGNESVLPFAVNNPTEQNRDLLFEIDKHLAIILEDQRESSSFTQMKEKLDSVAAKSRSVSGEKTSAQNYRKLKEYQYEYYEYLKAYLPLLLKKEKFFTSVFK